MTKINLKIGLVFFSAFASVFLLSGCGEKNAPAIEHKQEQVQVEESKTIQGSHQSRGKMPTAMAESCQGKAEGDSCEVTMPSRNGEDGESKVVGGNCKKNQESENLFCALENMPVGRGQNRQN